MGRNEKERTIHYQSNPKPLLNQNEADIRIILNAVDTAIREFQIRQKKFIPNAFKYFAERCGYKYLNQFYSIYEMRPGYELKIKDAKIVYDLTGDERIKEAIDNYFSMKNN